MSTTVNAGFLSALFSGLLNNLLIMLLSSVIPIGIGVGFTFAMRAIKKKGIRILLRIIGIFSYALAPAALIMTVFFRGIQISALTAAVLALNISHLGFFLIFYDNGSSAAKNIVVNSFSLLSSTFMWSMVSCMVGCKEVLNVCRTFIGMTYNYSYYVYALLAGFAVLLILNIPRVILNETMR